MREDRFHFSESQQLPLAIGWDWEINNILLNIFILEERAEKNETSQKNLNSSTINKSKRVRQKSEKNGSKRNISTLCWEWYVDSFFLLLYLLISKQILLERSLACNLCDLNLIFTHRKRKFCVLAIKSLSI